MHLADYMYFLHSLTSQIQVIANKTSNIISLYSIFYQHLGRSPLVYEKFLIPDTPRPMMRRPLPPLVLHLLDGIIEEEINQNRIHPRPWIFSQYLLPYQLHTPDTARPELDLPVATRGDVTFELHGGFEGWAVLDAAELVEHLRDAVVGKHGYLVNVVKFAVGALALEASPEIGDEDLGAFEEADGFLAGEGRGGVGVVEAGKVGGEGVDQASGGVVGGGYEVEGVAGEFLVEDLAGFTETGETGGEEGHFFRGGGAEDVFEGGEGEFFFVLPEVRVCNGDALGGWC